MVWYDMDMAVVCTLLPMRTLECRLWQWVASRVLANVLYEHYMVASDLRRMVQAALVTLSPLFLLTTAAIHPHSLFLSQYNP